MIHAYDEEYLDDAMRNLGEAMDYAVNSCNMDIDQFMDLFIMVGLAEQFGSGVPKYVSGMSGIELVCETMDRSGIREEFPEAEIVYDCSSEYWCGWILAYYQWYSGKNFSQIKHSVTMKEIERLYSTLHEVSEEKFADIMDQIISRRNTSTRLQLLRRAVGYSQKLLAVKSGVNLRNIQQYEQRVKDINKAAAGTLRDLARVLGCRMEDLLE